MQKLALKGQNINSPMFKREVYRQQHIKPEGIVQKFVAPL